MRPEELSALSLDADLVVLSACATAVSGGHAGDEGLRGLVAPLIEAGARGVAATLWAVDDQAQRLLVSRFYQRLARGESTASALRGAKLDCLPRRGVAAGLGGAGSMGRSAYPASGGRGNLGGNVRSPAERPR